LYLEITTLFVTRQTNVGYNLLCMFKCSDAKDVATAPQWAQLSVGMALNPSVMSKTQFEYAGHTMTD